MQDAAWYFVGRDGQRQGPVAAADIATAYRGGMIARDGLVWRQGMAEWLPLEQLASELGIGPEDHAVVPPPVPDAAPPIVTTRRSQGIDDKDIVYAGFVRRWAAFIIDRMILVVPIYAILLVFLILLTPSMFRQHDSAGGLIILLVYPVYFIAAALYYAGQESSKHQATLGKRALGIKVTDANGGRLNFGQALGRWFAAALSYLTCYVGFAMARLHRAQARCTTWSPIRWWWIAGPIPNSPNARNANCRAA
jgi:uncharacterized RDD family membrane protein YckC